jgi:serine phosphatase RsbU (regulator of sigma subunit)
MPFHLPAQDGSLGRVRYCWRLHPAGGTLRGGDAVFVETGRPDGHALFLLADATGHGEAAAEVVRLLHERILPDRRCAGQEPAELLRRLHGMLQPVWARTERFVAALAVQVAGNDGSMRAAAAGLPPPWARAPGSPWTAYEIAGGFVLGVPAEGEYGQTELWLGPGSFVLTFSDGLYEALDRGGRQYGHGPLAALLAGLPEGLPGPPLLDALLADVRNHAGDPWPQDDTTLLCIWRPED